MIDGFLSYLESRTLLELGRDALDVLLVYYLCYRVLLVVRGTRAIPIALGLGVILLLYLGAQALELISVLTITGTLIQSIFLVIVVVFQNDIRRALQRVGSQAWFGSARAQESRVIEEVVEAVTELARHRVGAIIAFEQDANLDEFVGIHKGHPIDAEVTSRLLVGLFVPENINALHDGAVIIRNLRIAKAGVFFPMPEARVIDESFGSRHRAALGITEETDAVVVVVSEERGSISFCFNGNIASNLDGPKLRTMLDAILRPKEHKRRQERSASQASKLATPAAVGRQAEALMDVAGGTETGSPPARAERSQDGDPSRLRAIPRGAGSEASHFTPLPTPLTRTAAGLGTENAVKPKPLRAPFDHRGSERQPATEGGGEKRESSKGPATPRVGSGPEEVN